MGLAHSPSIVTRGMVLCLDALNVKSYPGSGTSWFDLGGDKNHGVLTNSPTYNTTHFSFDGTNDFVYTSNAITTTLTAYTIAVWFKTSLASGKKIIGYDSDQTSPTSSSYDKHIYIGTDGKIYFGNFGGGINLAISQGTYNNNSWTYAVGTYGGEGTTLRLYINGISDATGTSNSMSNYTGYWRLGGPRLGNGSWTNGSDGYFTGDIALAQVYHRGLTALEVQQNFNALRGRFGL